MTRLVIYHAGCYDGFCAAWLFKKAYHGAEFHAAHYGTEPPDVAGKSVYVVDFSYKRDVMRAMGNAAHMLTVLDHHATAEKELAGLQAELPANRNPMIRFENDKSGGRMAWDYLSGAMPRGDFPDRRPWLVDYTEDRDLWKWALPESHAVNAALRSYPLDFTRWDQLAERDPVSLAVEGTAIVRRERQIVEQHVRHAREVEIGGHVVPCVNATVLFSEIAGELSRGKPFGACYFDRFDGRRVYSLRSDPHGLDVSEVAKKFGGGGHEHAAGYEVVVS